MPPLLLLALHGAPAHAAAGAPDWDALAPWRTWVVVDDLSLPRHWFALEDTPGLRQRCEVGIAVDDPRAEPVVHCGEASLSDRLQREAPAALRRMERRALASLEPLVGRDAVPALAGLRMTWLGPLVRVSFRQVVVVRPAPSPDEALAWTHASYWDVDLDTGVVDHGVVGSRVSQEPLCMTGLHARCEAPPRLLPFQPEPGWDGHLFDVEADGVQGAATRAVEGLVREAALAAARGRWVPPPARDPGEGLLPPTHDAGASLGLEVQTRSPAGALTARRVTVELPLNEAAGEGVVLRAPVDGSSLTLEVDARLAGGRISLRLAGPGASPRALELDVRCALIRDGARAALGDACPIPGLERSLTWVGDSGVERVVVTADAALLPMLGPSRGASLR